MRSAALLLETLRLDCHAEPDRLRAEWMTVEMKGLSRLVQFEGCALWLRRRLAEINAVDFGDRRFRVWLEHRSREIAARNMLVDAQTDRVVRALNKAGVPFVLIKGAARRALAGSMPYADARATNDVDILIPVDSARRAWEKLQGAGYEQTVGPPKRPVVTPPGHFHLQTVWDWSRVAVELHTSTSQTVPASEAWRRASSGARQVERAGLLVPVQACPTELLWHALTHAFNHDWEAFRLRYLLDAAVVWAAPTPIDWLEIARRLDSAEVQNRSYAVHWLGVAAALAGATLPEPVATHITPIDFRVVLRSRLALLQRMPARGRLRPRLLDGIAHVVMAADRWSIRSIQGTRRARASSLTTSH